MLAYTQSERMSQRTPHASGATMNAHDLELIDTFCLTSTLKTYDPYDLWKTPIGLKVKELFNSSRVLGAAPALGFTLADQLINNSFRLGYKKQEYPIARGLAAQTLLHLYTNTGNTKYLRAAESNLEWLRLNVSKGYSGACWGLGFKWPAGKGVIYDANTPHVTHTPYALEAFHLYTQITRDTKYVDTIKSCFLFYENDLQVMYEDEESMAVSYGPFRDRIVANAVAYAMYSYAIFRSYFPEKKSYMDEKIQKLFSFIKTKQLEDGSWLYSPDDENSFIDCFHSCFVMKNLFKTNQLIHLDGASEMVASGYDYLNQNFLDRNTGLYKRFTKSNKLSLVKFDLYDNAEVLSLANLLGDESRVERLRASIRKNFVVRKSVYSVIDFVGVKRNRNMLRWAVMPYLHALSCFKLL